MPLLHEVSGYLDHRHVYELVDDRTNPQATGDLKRSRRHVFVVDTDEPKQEALYDPDYKHVRQISRITRIANMHKDGKETRVHVSKTLLHLQST